MPQGKLKVKAKIPVGAKIKNKTISKPKDIQKRNRPAKASKSSNLLRSAITKAINETNETNVREKAVFDGKTLHVLPSDDVQPVDKPGGGKMKASKSKNTKKARK